MPSDVHEWLILLFRNRPQLASELLGEALHVELPKHAGAQVESADLTDLQPTEYRADLVVRLSDGNAVLGIVVEVQLSRDERKSFVWPVYVTTLRARLECPVRLRVVTHDESVARWARKAIDIDGGSSRIVPLALGPSSVPELTAEAGRANPELAVLSAIAHGQDSDPTRSIRIAQVAVQACEGLDPERAKMYVDISLRSLSDQASEELEKMDPATYEYQSKFAKRYLAQGRVEGQAALIIKQLSVRFGQLSDAVRGRISAASGAELDAIGQRLLTAQTLDDAFNI